MTTRWKDYAGIALKTLSWRATAGIDTFVMTFLITGNLAAAAAVAVTESFSPSSRCSMAMNGCGNANACKE
jgi:hypothetical protein